MVGVGKTWELWGDGHQYSKSRYKVEVIQGTESSVRSGRLNAWRRERSCSVGCCFYCELFYKLMRHCKYENSPKQIQHEPYRPGVGRGWCPLMRCIIGRRCPHVNNSDSDDVRVAMSVESVVEGLEEGCRAWHRDLPGLLDISK
jgi:hypothetical protein